ncbi:MAG: M55 family metallopeptidase, partial [Jatrophihabitans sp.]
AQVRCNGQELGEIGLNAALAAQYGAVPVLVTGDDTLVREAESRPPNFAGAVDLEIDVLRPFMTERACLIPASSCGLRSLSAFTPPTSRTRTTSST